MKLHNNQKFQVGGTDWRYEKNGLPQGSMIGTTKDGENLSSIVAKDWSRPISAPGNAVLLTRSAQGNEWNASPATDLKPALKQGANHIRSYQQDKQIARVEAFFNDPQRNQPRSADVQIGQASQRAPKFRKLKDLHDWQQQQKAQGKDTMPPSRRNQDMGM